MSKKRRSTIWLAASLVSVTVLLVTYDTTMQAVPSFSRQTGLACSGCHYTPPELNAAGRRFKLLGYTDRADNTPSVQSKPTERNAGLDILKTLPLSAALNFSFTSTKAPIPDTQNGTLQLPQEVSLFFAGAVSKHVGTFLEFAFDPSEDHFGLEMADVRYARTRQLSGRELIYGITINNGATMEDVWNSTPMWSFPFNGSDVPPGPMADPTMIMMEGVAGVGGYAMWDNHLYGAATLYRTTRSGAEVPLTGEDEMTNIHGVAPYWRVAWQQTGTYNDFEIGAYGMHVNSTPFGFVGPRDSYTNIGADFQLNRTIPQWGRDVISLRGTYMRQNSSLNGLYDAGMAGFVDHHLNTAKLNAIYHFGNRLAAGAGWFTVTGTPDPMLYSQDPIGGSANGDPRTSGYVLDLSWWPNQNIDLEAQYTGYSSFNGAGTNYDGAGRNASGNNAVYLLARWVF